MTWRRRLAALLHPAPAAAVAADGEAARTLAARLAEQGRPAAARGAGLAFHVVDTGDCGGCALELAMLHATAWNLERLGLVRVATPRHADALLVTGVVTRTLHPALRLAWEAAPTPPLVVAVGDCAIDGGVFKGSYATAGGAATAVPVDLVLRGCPPGPAELLAGLATLLAVGDQQG